MKLKFFLVLLVLVPVYSQAGIDSDGDWNVGSGIEEDGTVTAEEALEYLRPILGTYHGERRNFDKASSIVDAIFPAMIPSDMTISINDRRLEIHLSAQENCVQRIGALKRVSTLTYLLTPNTISVKAKFTLEQENCPMYNPTPYALLEYGIDKETGALENLILTRYTSSSVKGGREVLFRQ